jgi:hypothetical protein
MWLSKIKRTNILADVMAQNKTGKVKDWACCGTSGNIVICADRDREAKRSKSPGTKCSRTHRLRCLQCVGIVYLMRYPDRNIKYFLEVGHPRPKKWVEHMTKELVPSLVPPYTTSV